MRDYTKYQVWNESLTLSVKIYQLTQCFPDEEKFGLISQLRRAVVSIASNIAEGASRTSEKEFSHFLEISLGSAFEIKTQLIISMKIGLLNDELGNEVITKIEKICKQLNGLRNSLKQPSVKG